MAGIKLADFDLSGMEERDLSVRNNVSSDLAEVIATGEGCVFHWNSAQLSQAKTWAIENNAHVSITQAGTVNETVRKYKNGKETPVERFKRDVIIVRPSDEAFTLPA
jgi:hypothetical protein